MHSVEQLTRYPFPHHQYKKHGLYKTNSEMRLGLILWLQNRSTNSRCILGQCTVLRGKKRKKKKPERKSIKTRALSTHPLAILSGSYPLLECRPFLEVLVLSGQLGGKRG